MNSIAIHLAMVYFEPLLRMAYKNDDGGIILGSIRVIVSVHGRTGVVRPEN
jgi:hypothetical protein